jgi:formate dehydrogenase subunit beta
MKTAIRVENGETLQAVQSFLRHLLEEGAVQALLVPMRTPGGAVAPALVSNPNFLVEADPLAPVMPVNAATLAGQLGLREPRAKVGVVLRSCEIRALVELVKLQQASVDDLTLIAVDCAGTCEVSVYQQRTSNGSEEEPLWKRFYQIAVNEPQSVDPDVRLACRICEQPVYEGADIVIELLGSDLEKEISLSVPDTLAEKLGLSAAETAGRDQVLDQLVSARKAALDAKLDEIHRRLEGEEGLVGVFDACIRCHNCMNVCPICYCKTCVFKSAIFDHEPMQYVNWSVQKGACRMPTDTTLFHLTRLNHMALSCVGCGMCTQACPADLPVGLVFQAIGGRLQGTFEYTPGRALEEVLPLVTFREDEWTELGGS